MMSSATAGGRTETSLRVARLACMPGDADAAVARFKRHVQSAWTVLEPRDRSGFVVHALRTAAPMLPGLPPAAPADLGTLLSRLDEVLAQHHPEELRVVSFAWLSALLEGVHRRDGSERAAEILDRLEFDGRE